MSDFTTDPNRFIQHVDGWGYEITEYDDGLIRIQYKDDDGKACEDNSVEGIWPESARLLAGVLIEIANRLEPETKNQQPHFNEEFRKGFYAGLAYGTYGDEANVAAQSAAKVH